ncbi:triose-phosphate isomerase [Algiphilus sp.]|uniref:triose-phosphate isomerase n=1 Tax=Algiphilus sp. TaxID=1872431 RepID=UPI0025BF3FCD|nr:triose-phosphate isomerase [Algiphilus sp.]MCK5769457.1 triose-phosphate isomerase [Algiphilus sp.]
MSRKPVVAANWKMHGDQAASGALAREVAAQCGDGRVEVIVCPPACYLRLVAEALAGSACVPGGQDISEVVGSGAHTGDISGAMLADCGAGHAIVGHSERRATRGEDDARVAAKFIAAQEAGLIPILCVGETLEERDGERTEAVLGRQLEAVIDAAGIAAFTNALIAYEPVWAIGTGRTASPEQAEAAHAFLRATLRGADATIADSVRILYGGSVKPDNAASLFAQPDVDGGLIGGASLKAADFTAIVRAAGGHD